MLGDNIEGLLDLLKVSVAIVAVKHHGLDFVAQILHSLDAKLIILINKFFRFFRLFLYLHVFIINHLKLCNNTCQICEGYDLEGAFKGATDLAKFASRKLDKIVNELVDFHVDHLFLDYIFLLNFYFFGFFLL